MFSSDTSLDTPGRVGILIRNEIVWFSINDELRPRQGSHSYWSIATRFRYNKIPENETEQRLGFFIFMVQAL